MTLKKNEEYFDKKFVGLYMVEADLSNSEFEGCVFERCNWQGSDLVGCIFLDCVFKNCNLSVVSVDKCRISETRFQDCKLVGIKWFHVNQKLGFDCQYIGCDLSLGNFAEMDLSKSVIKGCQCKEVYLAGCNMAKLSLGKTNLDGAIFDNTNLEKADLSKAYNYIINPNLNNIKKAKFSLPEAVGLLKNLDIEIVE